MFRSTLKTCVDFLVTLLYIGFLLILGTYHVDGDESMCGTSIVNGTAGGKCLVHQVSSSFVTSIQTQARDGHNVRLLIQVTWIHSV